MHLVDASKKDYPIHEDPESSLLAETAVAKIVKLIPPGSSVLDVGCATGYLAELLRPKNCVVTGIEVNPAAAKVASEHCAAVISADIETQTLSKIVGRKKFDVIVFADVLEHLRAPGEVLRSAHRVLKPGGRVIASIPNVAHGAIRLSLLAGNFDYTELGILDDTHLRFFTAKSMDEMFLATGFKIEQVDRTTIPLFSKSDLVPEVRQEDYAPEVVEEIRRDSEHETLQFIVRATPLAQAVRARELTKRFLLINTELVRANATLRLRDVRIAELERERGVLLAATQTAHQEMLKAQAAWQRRGSDFEQAGEQTATLENCLSELTDALRTSHDEFIKAQAVTQGQSFEIDGAAARANELESQLTALSDAMRGAQQEMFAAQAALRGRHVEIAGGMDRVKNLQAQLAPLAVHFRDARARMMQAQAELAGPDAELRRLAARVIELESIPGALSELHETRLQKLKAQVAQSHQLGEVGRAAAHIASLEGRTIDLMQQMHHARQEMSDAREVLQGRSSELAQTASHAAELESRCSELATATRNAHEHMLQAQKALEGRDAEVRAAVRRIEDLEQQHENAAAALASRQADVASLQAELEKQQRANEEALAVHNTVVRNAHEEVSRAQKAFEDRDAEVRAAVRRIADLEQQHENAAAALASRQADVASLQADLEKERRGKEAALALRQADLSSLQAELEKQQRAKEEALAVHNTVVRNAHEEMLRAQKAFEERDAEVRAAVRRIEDLEHRHEDTAAALASRQADVASLQAELEKRQREKEEALAVHTAEVSRVRELELQAAQTHEQLNEANRRFTEQTQAFLSATQAETERLAQLIETVQSSRFWKIKSIFGRLRRAFSS